MEAIGILLVSYPKAEHSIRANLSSKKVHPDHRPVRGFRDDVHSK
jgi:hypothetical protein